MLFFSLFMAKTTNPTNFSLPLPFRRSCLPLTSFLSLLLLSPPHSAEHDKKIQLKEALESGKRIPKALQREADDLKDALELDDPSTQKLRTHIDDEYQNVGIYDPKILITSSRDPSNRLLQFVKELRLCLPNAQRINRGGTIISELGTLISSYNRAL